MISVLIAVVIVSGIVLLLSLYMTLLDSLYPEQLRTNEVLHLRTHDLWMLRLCRYRKSRASGEPVLFVHGLGANQHNFTNPENGCLVDYLSSKGYDCWTVDLRGTASSRPPFERSRNEVLLEDFFTEDLPAVIGHILKTTNYSKLHWVGHSMGGMLLYAYVQTHGSDQIASAVALGAPLDFSDAGKAVPAWLVKFGIRFPSVAGQLVRGSIPLLRLLRLSPPAFPLNRRNIPKRMHAGHFISMIEDPLPGLLRQVLRWMHGEKYVLCDGTLDIVKNLPSFPIPLLAFYGYKDPFVGYDRAKKVFDSILLEDKKAILCAKAQGFAEDYSHCDLAFSREAESEIFEPVARWLAEHSCVKQQENGADPHGVAAAVVSPEKRAHMLSGAAYSHLHAAPAMQEGASVKKSPQEEDAASESTKTDFLKSGDTPNQYPSDDLKRRVSRVVVTRSASSKEPDAPPKASAPKTAPPAGKKAAAEQREGSEKKDKSPVKGNKKSAPQKKVDMRPATAKARKAGAAPPKSVSSVAATIGGIEISPEALARAESIRAARNESLSQLLSDLDKDPGSGKS